MNRRGTDKIVSVYWFAILFLVAGGIVYMVYSFYGGSFDIRGVEARLLTNKLANCISEGPQLSAQALSITPATFLDSCMINLKTNDLSGSPLGQYYVSIEGLNGDLSAGNVNLRGFCAEGLAESKKTPVCITKKLYLVDSEGIGYELNLTAVVNKIDKNA